MGEAATGGAWLSYVFFVCVGVITLGLLWFRVLRPMLEDFGLLIPTGSDQAVVNHSTPHAEAYVEDELLADEGNQPAVPAFEQAELALFVPPVQLPNIAQFAQVDIVRVDTLARLMAAGAISESSAITTVWDGRDGVARVSKGSSRAYTERRDILRALATHYGWQPPTAEAVPELLRQVPINGGQRGHVEL